jgi:hypothetical protein
LEKFKKIFLKAKRTSLPRIKITLSFNQDNEKRLKERLIAEQHRATTLEKISKEQVGLKIKKGSCTLAKVY